MDREGRISDEDENRTDPHLANFNWVVGKC